jgi:very-short-patch-repair endonuclease
VPGEFVPSRHGPFGVGEVGHLLGSKLPPPGSGLVEGEEADRALAALARRQHGVVTIEQAVAEGLSKRAVAHRIRRGWLVRLHRGVYQVGPLAAERGREMAAMLAYGSSSLLSHNTASDVWAIGPPYVGAVHVTVPGDQARSRPGITVHRTCRTASLEAVVHRGLRLTGPARTLRDLATHLPQHQLDRATEQAQLLNLTTRVEIEAQLDGGRGTRALRRALLDEPTLTRSEAERLLRQLIRRARLPLPETNVRIHGHEVDCVWRSRRLVVEVDGYAYHRSRAAFERDRRRDADLTVAGYTVVRFTWRQLTTDPYAVVAQLTVLLTR